MDQRKENFLFVYHDSSCFVGQTVKNNFLAPAIARNSNLFFDMKTKGSCTDLTDNYEYNRISGPLGEFFMGSGF